MKFLQAIYDEIQSVGYIFDAALKRDDFKTANIALGRLDGLLFALEQYKKTQNTIKPTL